LENEAFIRMFIEEARLATRLEHPNIVRTYEFGEVGGRYFTAMEYLPGEDLQKVLNKLAVARQRMPFALAATLMQQVCAGLHFAHELTDVDGAPLDLVHRDVNPANVIVTYTGEVKLLDFGVAKTTSTQTQSGTIKGKLAYMSPEQIIARGVDRRSDVFSAGVVLWELLTSRPLFVRDNDAATLYAIMNDPIPPVSRYRLDVPPALEAIVDRALARVPADRYETAEQMSEALGAFLDTQDKCDARSRGRMLEDLFGAERAEAKRSISQSRALSKNVSLVMKLRSEVRTDLASAVNALRGSAERRLEPAPERSSKRMMIVLALIIVAAIGSGLAIVMSSRPQTTPVAARAAAAGTISIESDPPGAAISLGGEPTGLRTPAVLSGLSTDRVTVQLALDGYQTRTETLVVPVEGQTTERLTLIASSSRLAIAGLPAGATIIVDGEEFEPGTVIDVAAGRHEVILLDADGNELARQPIEATGGLMRWTLDGKQLTPLAP
jgi:eukaryotic-like serine/threonine-protein kinase